jgi:hypothetical protein
MGFNLRGAVVRVDDDAEAERICAAAREVFPAFVQIQRFRVPFAGVIAAYDPIATHERIVDDYAAHGYASEDAACEAAAEAVDGTLAVLSRRFPTLPFAFVDVDCFGGACTYHGHVTRDGMTTFRAEPSPRAHQELFARLDVANPGWHFAPFTRGFMESGVALDLSRLPITYSVHARWEEPHRLAAIRATMLPLPWKVTIYSETSVVIVHGESFYASLHPVDGGVELRGRSFVDLDQTRQLARELADDEVALEVRRPSGPLS